MTFDNAAIATGVAEGAVTYSASWFLFDNATGETKPLSNTQSATTTIEAPRGLPTEPGVFVAVDIAAESAGHPAWGRPVGAHFKRDREGWKLVGLQRLPENLSTARTSPRATS